MGEAAAKIAAGEVKLESGLPDIRRQRRDEAVYRAIADGYPNGAVVIYDHDLRFLAAGGESLDVLGFSPLEMIGKTMAEVYDAETVARIAPRYRAALAGKATRQDLEYGGRSFTVEYRPIVDEQGQIVAAMGASRDITERVQMEEQLRRANLELATQAEVLAGSEAALREAAASLEARVEERTAELLAREEDLRLQNERLEILHDIDRAILAELEPDEIALAAIERVQELTGAVRGTVTVFDDATESAEILASTGIALLGGSKGDRISYTDYWFIDELKTGHVAVLEDFLAAPDTMPWKASRLRKGIRSATIVPLTAKGNVIGAFALNQPEPGPLAPDIMALVLHVADSLAVAIHNARLNQDVEARSAELAELSHRLVALQESERGRVAGMLFNQVGQVLAAVHFQLSVVAKDPGAEGSAQRFAEIARAVDGAMRDLHDLATELHPVGLDRSSLVAVLRQAMHQFGRDQGITVHFHAGATENLKLRRDAVTAVFRVTQEALANVARHAGTRNAELRLERSDRHLLIVVRDDGYGPDLIRTERGNGISFVSMRERIESVGGSIAAGGGAGGNWVRVRVPLEDGER